MEQYLNPPYNIEFPSHLHIQVWGYTTCISKVKEKTAFFSLFCLTPTKTKNLSLKFEK